MLSTILARKKRREFVVSKIVVSMKLSKLYANFLIGPYFETSEVW